MFNVFHFITDYIHTAYLRLLWNNDYNCCIFNSNQVSINKKAKTIKLTSSDKSEVKEAKKTILINLRKLYKESRVLKREG